MKIISWPTEKWQRFWRCSFNTSMVILLTCGLLWFGSLGATAKAATVEDGKTLFEQSCAACHSIDGSSASYGPGLQTVTQRRDRDWLVRWIAAPEKVIESGDAIATELLEQYSGVPMPNMGLSPEEVEAIVGYMESVAANADSIESIETEAAAEAQIIENTEESNSVEDATILPTGNPGANGQKLFAGTIPFENGGPACMSCHTVDVVGALKGGTLGPNLTHIVDRYTAVGLKSVLPTLPYPTMQGIYENHLLTEAEQAQLLAFFIEANQSAAASTTTSPTATATPAIASEDELQVASFHLSSTWKFILLGWSGFFLLALLSQLLWRDRLTGVRQRLVAGQK
jgi:mono/diheme cytochrome c family protein